MNYPLARDARTAVTWRLGNNGSYWCASLPGEDRIRLYLPYDTPERRRRLPTAFDMNLLFLALAEVQRTGNANITLRSFAAILRDLGLTTHTKNRKLLKASFALWNKLIISFEGCWYLDKGEHETRDLPPPFVKVRYQGNVIAVTVDSAWAQIITETNRYARSGRAGYYVRVPLLLPLNACDQNAVLMVLTATVAQRLDEIQITKEVGRSSFARKIGLGRKNRAKRLNAVLERVNRWFLDSGGEASAMTGTTPPDKLIFLRQMPKPPWQTNDRHSRSRGL
jgi:hypothetical protein